MNLLELSDVPVVHRIRARKLFGHDNVYALTDANLTLNAGETVGVVGESGCGKSTLAKVIVGLQPPTQGTVRFTGKHVGMVFQDPSTALNRRLPVTRIIRDPLDVHKEGTPAERDDRVR